MLLDLQGLLACQPLADDVRPAESEGQQRNQFLQAFGMNNVRLFQAKAPTLQAREERFNLPAALVVRKRRKCLAWRNHDHVFARRETQPTDKQRQAPDRACAFNDQGFADPLRTEQAPNINQLSTPVCDHSVFTNPDAEVYRLRAQPREPITAHKLPVCTKISNRLITEDAPELSDERNALLLVRTAFLLKNSPEHGESHATVRDANDHDIQRGLAKIPVGAIQCDDPRGRHSQKADDEASDLCIRHRKKAEETLRSLVVRLRFGAPQKDLGHLREVDCSDFDQGNDEASQKVDTRFIPRYIVSQRSLQQANVGHCALHPFKFHLAMNSIRIQARWPFMQFQRSFFVLY